MMEDKISMNESIQAGAPDINLDLSLDDPIHKNLANLDTPRKHYQWYYSSPEANKDMHLKKDDLHKFLRSYYHMKSADWYQNINNDGYPSGCYRNNE